MTKVSENPDVARARHGLRAADDALSKARRAVKEWRSVVNAPPDPKPHHRTNLLSWRQAELEDAIDDLLRASDKCRLALRVMISRHQPVA